MENKKYIIVKVAAEILNVNPMTLRRWDNRGILKEQIEKIQFAFDYKHFNSENFE